MRQLYSMSGLVLGLMPLLYAAVTAVEYYTTKPDYIDSCHIYEPGFTNCSTHSIQKVMSQVVKGIPEILDTIGPLEPLKVDRIEFKQDNNEVATIKANITEMYVRGFSKLVIKESRVSKKDFSWQTKIFLPKLRLDGKYQMSGRILLLPLNGAGGIYLELENVDMLMHTKTRLYEKGGFTFYNVTDIRVALTMTGMKSKLDNLFGGQNKAIEDSTNELFNENWRDLFEALSPLITDTVQKILLRVMQKLFHLMPANFFVEDIPTSTELYGKHKK